MELRFDQRLDWVIRSFKSGKLTKERYLEWLTAHKSEIEPARYYALLAEIKPEKNTLAAKYGTPILASEVASVGVDVGNEATLEQRIARLNRIQNEPKSNEIIHPYLRGKIAGRPSGSGSDDAGREPISW